MATPSDGNEAGVSKPTFKPSRNLAFVSGMALFLMGGYLLVAILDVTEVIGGGGEAASISTLFALIFVLGVLVWFLAAEIRRVYKRLAKLELQMYGKD